MLQKNLSRRDRPLATLVNDLDQRGLLDASLVIWAGEFGTTSMAQGDGLEWVVGSFLVGSWIFLSNPANSWEVAVVPMPKVVSLFTESATNGSGPVPTERQLADQPYGRCPAGGPAAL